MERSKKITYFPFSGPALLDMSLLNKGNAFTKEERKLFNLEGLLPYHIETIEEQVKRVYHRLHSQANDLEKHIYLRSLQDTNETLFYRLTVEHFSEILPLIYTPTVGLACEKFSQIYRERRGLFLSYPDKGSILDHVWNVTRKNVKVIVITDGERILGLGDLGTGGMGIPIGKLSLYTAGGGISPAYTLPIYVDVGTNNESLLADDMYIGWRHKRVDGEEYYAFMEEVITALDKRWPGVLIQFEDFAQKHAFPLLQKYKGRFCSFNDDIQGTAAITLASLIAAAQKGGFSLAKEKIVFAGAGSAACGIADLIVRYKMQFGVSKQEAAASVFLHNSKGLICEASENMYDYQRPYLKETEIYASWRKNGACPSLMETVQNSGAGVLLGLSAQKGLFTQEMVEQMAKNKENPVIFPLSNPTSKAEALPQDLIEWTKGKAIVAAGSPFAPYQFEGKTFTFSQCNNCYIFPGIGLGAISSKTTRVSDTMILKAAEALASYSAEKESRNILPPLEEVPTISRRIAFEVVKQAIQEGFVLPMEDEQILKRIERNYWIPEYREYRRTSF